MKKKTNSLKTPKIKSFDFPQKSFFIEMFKDKVFLVGGIIRDFLLYGPTCEKDIDLVVTGHTYEEIETMLKPHGKTNTVGKSFAVVKFTRDNRVFDIAIPRRDVKRDAESHCHKNFIVDSGPHVTLEDDLRRRDFTCNSIALRLVDGMPVDPFDGIGAIGEKKIFMTGPETFFDDPLRILRGARFASVHGFTVDPEIYRQSREVTLAELSKERVVEELFRLLLESHLPSLGLAEYWRLTVLEKLFPRLYALSLTIQDAIFHPETDEFGHHTVWGHTLIAVDIAAELARRFLLDNEQTLALLLGTLFHDVGKPATTRWEFKRGRMTVTSILHDSRGVEIAGDILSDLRVETRNNFPIKDVVLKMIKYHHRIYELYRNREDLGFKAIARLVRDMGEHDLLLLLLDVADRRSREPDPLELPEQDEVVAWYLKQKEIYNISHETIKPLVMGRHLIAEGFAPGKQMGEYLDRLYERQLDGDFGTLEEGLEIFRKEVAPAAPK